MRIEPSTPLHARPQNLRAAEEQLQSVFSDVLIQSGRSGYASAETRPSQHTLEQDIRQGWSDWFSIANADGDHASRAVDQDRLENSYGEIISRAWTEGGYHAPSGFLQQLNPEELETVQHVHRLADPINTGSLSEEGALNLLIPPPAQVDANRDGVTQVGKGSLLRFPDSLTPPSVVDAWNEATADMDFREKSHYQFRMMLPTLIANMQTDAQGNYVGRREPGSAGYVNPMADPSYSYIGLSQQYLDSLDYFKHQMPPEQYESQTAFWTEFQQSLKDHGAL